MKQRLSRAIIVLVVLIVVLVSWLATPPRAIVLPDGAELELKSVTHGTRHVYLDGSLRNRLLSLLPDKLRQKFGVKGPTLITGTTNLVLWLARHGTTPPILMLCDEAGHGAAPVSHATMSASVGDEAMEAWSFPVWPRRGRGLTLRVYWRTNWFDAATLVGECRLPNPVQDTYPTWTPDPLPITKQDGDLSFSLAEFLVGVDGASLREARPSKNPAEAWISAVFRVTQAGVMTEEWVPVSIVTMDATGNRLRHTWWDVGRGPHHVYYQWGLWPSEAAWKLRVAFSQRSGFAPGQLWTIRGLSLAETNLSANPAYQTNLQSVSIRLQTLMPARLVDGRRTLLLFESPDSGDSHSSLIEITDDQGREVPISGESWGEEKQSFDLMIAPGAKSLNLTFALLQSRLVEFLVKPQIVEATVNERPHPAK